MNKLIQLQGTDKQLYSLVGPLVMDPEVLRKNNNYPFKTTKEFVWFVAVEGKRVTGFMPIERRVESNVINNYYSAEGEVLSQLLVEVISALGTEKVLFSVTLVEDQSVFEEHGFEVEKEWKRYVKMRRG